MSAPALNCPNCGAELPHTLATAKMIACDYCESTVVLEDDALRMAGEAGVMAEEPSLFMLGREVRYKNLSLTPVGQVRFSYRHGWWDEFWTLNGEGGGAWISVDEGDIAIEKSMPLEHAMNPDLLKLGGRVMLNEQMFRITEADEGECVALRGEFPEELRVGQRFRYWHLTGPRGRLITLEWEDGEMVATDGLWIDPYEIRNAAESA